MARRAFGVWFAVLSVLLVAVASASAAVGRLCPLDGKEYGAEHESCPEHRVRLVRAEDFYRDPLTGMGFIRVEGGCFEMGLREGGGDAAPLRRECVDTFWMGVFEVTQAQWTQVMEENLSSFQECGPECPAENVNFIDVREFVGMLGRLTGKTYRLPTEAEWEYAARGGKHSQGYRYSGSNDPAAVAWYGENSGNKSHPVGRKEPNELGLYDLSGNVWEWVEGRYDEDAAGSDPKRPKTGAHRVIRGGGWISGAPMLQPGYRTNNATGSRNSSLGCRLVAVP